MHSCQQGEQAWWRADRTEEVFDFFDFPLFLFMFALQVEVESR